MLNKHLQTLNIKKLDIDFKTFKFIDPLKNSETPQMSKTVSSKTQKIQKTFNDLEIKKN